MSKKDIKIDKLEVEIAQYREHILHLEQTIADQTRKNEQLLKDNQL